jgi:hypothetical protein
MTSRTTADLAAKAKGDKSMPIKQEFVEDMYANVLQVLCAWLDWDCRIRVPSDDVHIRHSMSEVVTLKYTKVVALGEKAPFSEGQAMSLVRNKRKPTRTHRFL